MKEHLKTNIGQYAIILREKSLLLLTPVDGKFLVFVGGRLDSDEDDYKEALAREVKEETGLKLKKLEPFDIKLWSVNGTNHRYGVFFICDVEDAEIKLSHEHTDYKWYSYDEALDSDKIGEPGKEVIRKLRERDYM